MGKPAESEQADTMDDGMAATRSPRANEILDHAMRLFAERGYAGTSVADIQEAAGMTAGSGGLYKHFPSKYAVLKAGVERFIAEGQMAAEELPDPEAGDLESLLSQLGRRVLAALEQDRATMRVVWRDLPAFPELTDQFVHSRLQFGFSQLAGWLAALDDAGRATVEDPEATAAVLLGALAFHRVMDTMLGATPGQVSDERLVRAWVGLASRALAT